MNELVQALNTFSVEVQPEPKDTYLTATKEALPSFEFTSPIPSEIGTATKTAIKPSL